MRSEQVPVLQALQGVQEFLDAHAAELTPATYATQRTMLDGAVAQIEAHVNDQAAARVQAQQAVVDLHQSRNTLRVQHMGTIAKISRALLPETPGLPQFVLPGARAAGPKLVAAANAMATAVTPFAQVFVSHGEPATFVADLQAAAEAVQQAMTGVTSQKRKSVGATSGIGTEIQRAKRAVLLIDAIVSRQLAGNQQLQAEWNSAKQAVQVGAAAPGGSGSGSAAVATSPVAPATTATTGGTTAGTTAAPPAPAPTAAAA